CQDSSRLTTTSTKPPPAASSLMESSPETRPRRATARGGKTFRPPAGSRAAHGSVVRNSGAAVRFAWRGGFFALDIGRPPMDPEDVYLAELVACLSQLSEGINTAVDTSKASHTPAYTDAI